MRICLFSVLSWLVCAGASAADYEQAEVSPPEPEREFRGAWVATVHNIDWPSKKTLSAGEQKKEMITILEQAEALNLNAIVLQIRSECDALYPSELEPWAPCLTGEMGKNPGYDPLEFTLERCHERGLELHAWINPFRAKNSKYTDLSEGHVSATHPKVVREYGDKLWLEPTHDFSRERALAVVRDVLGRYDVDGVHIDDYFYPYPIKSGGSWKEFDDDESWEAYRAGGGKLSRDDWRREHVNRFVSELYNTVKDMRPSVKFGVSPFGVWRPGYPESTKYGLDPYDVLYADAKLWWNKGWVDYLAPQLYWRLDDPKRGFSNLLDWWEGENTTGRHLWPGIAASYVGDRDPKRSGLEPARQVVAARKDTLGERGPGHIHFSIGPILENRKGLADALQKDAYTVKALVPESPWMPERSLPEADLRAETKEESLFLRWGVGAPAERVRWWVIQVFEDEEWTTHSIRPGTVTKLEIDGLPGRVAVTPVGHDGELGKPAGLAKVQQNQETTASE